MPAPQPFTFRLPATPSWTVSMRAPVPARRLSCDADAPVLRGMELASRWVWHGRYGTIVIEVRGEDVFVNGERVEPHAP